MKLNEINEYVQTGAAVVAIVGILLLGYELRQSNMLATQQATSESWASWQNWYGSILESGVSEAVAKSFNSPELLTNAEKDQLYTYYIGWMSLYEADFDVFSYTSDVVVEREYEDAVVVLSGLFSSPYGRAWFYEMDYPLPAGLSPRRSSAAVPTFTERSTADCTPISIATVGRRRVALAP